MKLEYLDDLSEGGKYTDVVADKLIRLYDFDNVQANEFREAIIRTFLIRKSSLSLKELGFIEELNCHLTLRLADNDIGITTSDNKNFYCDLTLNGYENMIHLLEPFCDENACGYQWLYDSESLIEFLFSPRGEW